MSDDLISRLLDKVNEKLAKPRNDNGHAALEDDYRRRLAEVKAQLEWAKRNGMP